MQAEQANGEDEAWEPRQDSSKETRYCLLQAPPAAAQPVNYRRRPSAAAVAALPAAALCPWAAQSIPLASSLWCSEAGRGGGSQGAGGLQVCPIRAGG